MHPAELSLREEKRALRRAMAEQRDALTQAQREAMTERAAESFLELPEVRVARTVAGFISTRSEIDTEPLLAELRRRGVDVVLPRVSTGFMPPRVPLQRTRTRTNLVFGICGLLEPGVYCPELAAQEIDVFIVPGLVF